MFKRYQLTPYYLDKHFEHKELTQLAAQYYGIAHTGDKADLIQTVIRIGGIKKKPGRKKPIEAKVETKMEKGIAQENEGVKTKQEEIIEALKKFPNLQVKVDDKTWSVQKSYPVKKPNGEPLMGKETDKDGNPLQVIFTAGDSGHITVPLHLIVRKADVVYRSRFVRMN